MSDGIVRKQDFAAMIGVTPGRVSQWITERKIHGDAIVGHGVRAGIRVSVAKEQLRKNLDISQSLGMNAKARLNAKPCPEAASGREASATMPGAVAMAASDATDTAGEAAETLEDRIKTQRLTQLSLANMKASEEAAVRSGRYLKAEDARREMGRIAARPMTVSRQA